MPGVRGEWGAHQAGQVDRSQQAGAVGRQRLLAAGVGRVDGLAIRQVVAGVDPVDENDARFGVVVGRPGDAVEQRAGAQNLVGLAAEHQRPIGIGLDGRHERIGCQDREVEILQPAGLSLGGDEVLDVRMVAAHRRHHRAAARTG